MIVDLHTHIWESPEQLGRGAAQRLLRQSGQPWDRIDASTSAHDSAMEPVQHAVILGFESQMLGGSISPEQVARYVERKPGKYLGFAGIDPMVGRAKARVLAAKELGLVGVVISPAAQGFHPSHTLAWPLYEACAEHSLPLLVHGVAHLSSEGKLEFAQPVLLDEVAREFPKLKIIISQVGHPWMEETLTLMAKHRNVFADLSHVVTRPWQLYNLLHSAHQQGVMDRLLLGSDFPLCTPQKAITTIYSVNTLTQGTMLPSVPREQLRSIVERDVLEVLGLRKRKEKPVETAQTAHHSKAPATPVMPMPAVLPSVTSVGMSPLTAPASEIEANDGDDGDDAAAATNDEAQEQITPSDETKKEATIADEDKAQDATQDDDGAASAGDQTYELDGTDDDAPGATDDVDDAAKVKPENER